MGEKKKQKKGGGKRGGDFIFQIMSIPMIKRKERHRRGRE